MTHMTTMAPNRSFSLELISASLEDMKDPSCCRQVFCVTLKGQVRAATENPALGLREIHRCCRHSLSDLVTYCKGSNKKPTHKPWSDSFDQAAAHHRHLCMEKLDLQTTVVCRISEIEISSTLKSRFRGTFSSFSFLKLPMLVPLPMKMSLPHDSFAEPARRWPTPILASNTNASPEISPPVQRPGTARGSYARTTKLECG